MDIITLIFNYVKGLFAAQEKFVNDLSNFSDLEKSVSDLSNKTAAEFIGLVLTDADRMIRKSSLRTKENYIVQRQRQRTLISSVGDISFTHTLYKDKDGKTRCLLDELMHLPDRERFTEVAEAKTLCEAAAHSYQHAADSIKTNDQTITKTTVMNKVHDIEQEIPDMEAEPEEKKECEYLYIEADEDHIHRQKDGKEEKGCHIGKLIYLFEGKEKECDGRRKLIAVHYFGGIYAGTLANIKLWESVEAYIEKHYDQDFLKCVYISSDGGAWIRAGKDCIYKGRLVADKFHLMKYINRVAHFTLDDEEDTKKRLYKYIYKKNLSAAEELLTKIQENCEGSDRAVEECRTYLTGNWEAIQRAFHDKHVLGCSTEGHVSCVYSERMSSRPMGWSETGTDRMCKLRCFIRNYGDEKVIDLVKHRREKEQEELPATGTDGMIDETVKKKYTAQQKEAFRYAEAMHATLSDKLSIKKELAIREQLGDI